MAATAVSKSWSGPALKFSIIKECSKSRCRASVMELPHHTVETPTFMPVGTKGTMKGLLPEQVKAAGADIILGNTYHLGTRPGKDILEKAGGLHKWMNWDRGLLTDSGGFQMVSLLKLAKITEEGVTFQSPYDSSECVLTPEESISIQNAIGADIMMQLDDVVDVKETDYERFKEATLRTTRWLDRCIAANKNPDKQNLFPIVQGGLFPDLRDLSLEQLLERDSPGYAVGGLSGGEDKHQFWSTIHQCTTKLPVNKPRYCMGVGFAPDLVVCVALGVDMFDCVYPTRTARFGCALIESGQFSLKSIKYSDDLTPLDSSCSCHTCQTYTRAYIHAALVAKTTVACHLLSVHNIAYQMRLMRDIRESVKADRFPEFVNDFLHNFYKESVPQWIVDALKAVNITLTKKSESPAPACQQNRPHDGRTQTLAESGDDGRQTSAPTELAHQHKTDNFLNINNSIKSHHDLVVDRPKKCSIKEKNHSGDIDAWLDDDDFSEDKWSSKDQLLSGFETRSYDQGYRETLRQDHPDEVELGRTAGFVDAINLSDNFKDGLINKSSNVHQSAQKEIVCKIMQSANIDKVLSNTIEANLNPNDNVKNDYQPPNSLSATATSCLIYSDLNRSKLNPTHKLSMLDCSLSLMLLKFQTAMTEQQLREVVSIQESIKKELEEASLGFEASLVKSVKNRFTACNYERSEEHRNDVKDLHICKCNALVSDCSSRENCQSSCCLHCDCSGPLSGNCDSSSSPCVATDKRAVPGGICAVANHSITASNHRFSLDVRDIYRRAQTLGSNFNWKIPLL